MTREEPSKIYWISDPHVVEGPTWKPGGSRHDDYATLIQDATYERARIICGGDMTDRDLNVCASKSAEVFEPIGRLLQAHRDKTGHSIGWIFGNHDPTNEYIPQSLPSSVLEVFGNAYIHPAGRNNPGGFLAHGDVITKEFVRGYETQREENPGDRIDCVRLMNDPAIVHAASQSWSNKYLPYPMALLDQVGWKRGAERMIFRAAEWSRLAHHWKRMLFKKVFKKMGLPAAGDQAGWMAQCAAEHRCTFAVSGHTHTPYLAKEIVGVQEVLIANPGGTLPSNRGRPHAVLVGEEGLSLITVTGTDEIKVVHSMQWPHDA